MDFKLVSNYKPQGDQGRAIESLLRGVFDREQHQVLLGVTGSGKTYTMAKVIEAANRQTLVMAHNKTLAAQLYHEFKNFFSAQRRGIFCPITTTISPKRMFLPPISISKKKRRLTTNSTSCAFRLRDRSSNAATCVIVASAELHLWHRFAGSLLRHAADSGKRPAHQRVKRSLSKLVDILYDRTNLDFRRGTFRVRGDVIEVFPTYDDIGLSHRAVGR